ncbi:MAG TPA: c-type cytochrome [Humisphaera sp.]
MNRPTRLLSALVALLAAAAPAARADVDHLATLPDFKVDLVAKADKDKNGSWISMAKDGKGRLLIGGQRNQPVTRVTLADGKAAKEEVLKLPVSEIMGMLWAYDTLYVNGSDGKVFGLYRLTTTDGGDSYTGAELLREWKGGGGEHGAHGIVLGPDGKLYVVCGNFVDLPADLAPTSPFRTYADDLALPRAEDGNGFGAGRKPPGGFVARMDKDGKNCELFASGQRNTYDIGFNADGELFGFDSDMEWDWGTPWYRPTRVFHAVSGGDTGFREGSAKWPEYYPDSLPAVVNIGVGSPTGVTFGTGAKFPAKYQNAMYILDWTYGRVMAVHLTPQGAGYTATFENFVAPKGLVEKGGKKSPNNVTDVVIGDDGALYFTTGGRNTPGNLYRVTYAGKEPTAAAPKAPASDARAARHALEQFHAAANPKAVDAAWPALSSADRSLRYAARIAVERQPVEQWKAKALSETNPQAALTALLALARMSDKSAQPEILAALAKLPTTTLNESQAIEKIRVVQVSIARHGVPAPELAKPVVEELSKLYPAPTWPLNRELCQTLVALDAPDAVAKTLALMSKSTVQEEQVGYALYLRAAKAGWTPELRRQYLGWWTQDRSKLGHPPEVVKWFDEAGRAFSDGSSFARFLGNLHGDAQRSLSPQEALTLADVIKAYTPPGAKKPKAPSAPPKFVKNWEMADLEPAIGFTKGRNFERGKAAFEQAQCLACHRFGNEGGAVGPDITAVSSRFNRHDVLESIVDPNKVVSEQYQNTDVRTKDGEVVVGRVIEDKPEGLVLVTDMLKPEVRTTVKRADIKSATPSKLSPMPQGLINVLTKDEILDMLAYVESGGNKNHPAFGK